MEKEEIIKNNILLAEFLGGSVESFIDAESLPETQVYFPGSEWGYDVNDLDYNNSWSWLMRVVDKIEALGARVIIESGICTIDHALVKYHTTMVYPTKIEAVYLSAVKYVNFFNKFIKDSMQAELNHRDGAINTELS